MKIIHEADKAKKKTKTVILFIYLTYCDIRFFNHFVNYINIKEHFIKNIDF